MSGHTGKYHSAWPGLAVDEHGEPNTNPPRTAAIATPPSHLRRVIIVAVVSILLVNVFAGSLMWMTSSTTAMRRATADLATHVNAIQSWLAAPNPLDQTTLTHLSTEVSAAQADLTTLNGLVPLNGLLGGAQTQQLHQGLAVAIDETTAAQDLIQAAQLLQPGLRYLLATTLNASHPAASAAAPLTVSEINIAQLHLREARNAWQAASAQQNALLTSVYGDGILSTGNAPLDRLLTYTVTNFASLTQMLNLSAAVVDLLPGMLGVTHPHGYVLLLYMDTDQARAAGGSIGVYSVLTFASGGLQGRVVMRSASDFICTPACGQVVLPSQFKTWSQVTKADFGLGNSDLDPNFAFSGNLATRITSQQTGDGFSGAIAITPHFLQQVLSIVGPVRPGGGIGTVTSQNLPTLARIWHSQAANTAPSKPSPTAGSFDSAVIQAIMASLAHASQSQLLKIGAYLLKDLSSGDVQMYSTSPRIEEALFALNRAGSVVHPGEDTMYVTNTNLGQNFDSPNVAERIDDTITLDQHGAALHNLTVTYTYHPTTPAGVAASYSNLMTVVMPANAQMVRKSAGDCIPMNFPSSGGRTYACRLTLQPNHPTSISITWTVPGISGTQNHTQYTLFVQRQPGTSPSVHISIAAPPNMRIASASSGVRLSGARAAWSTPGLQANTQLQVALAR